MNHKKLAIVLFMVVSSATLSSCTKEIPTKAIKMVGRCVRAMLRPIRRKKRAVVETVRPEDADVLEEMEENLKLLQK